MTLWEHLGRGAVLLLPVLSLAVSDQGGETRTTYNRFLADAMATLLWQCFCAPLSC